jgi:hypothetical protein
MLLGVLGTIVALEVPDTDDVHLFGFSNQADLETGMAFFGTISRARGGYGVVTRGNGLAAQHLLRTRKPGKPAMVAFALARECLSVGAVEAGAHRNSLILLWANDDGRLVHLSYPLDPTTYSTNVAGGIVYRYDTTPRDDLMGLRPEERDGISYIDGSKYSGWPERMGVPPGEVACALGYPDGTYSNFVPLVREFRELPSSQPAEALGAP